MLVKKLYGTTHTVYDTVHTLSNKQNKTANYLGSYTWTLRYKHG